MNDPRPQPLTIDELADAASVPREVMLRRIAAVIEKRPWYRRLGFRWRLSLWSFSRVIRALKGARHE